MLHVPQPPLARHVDHGLGAERALVLARFQHTAVARAVHGVPARQRHGGVPAVVHVRQADRAVLFQAVAAAEVRPAGGEARIAFVAVAIRLWRPNATDAAARAVIRLLCRPIMIPETANIAVIVSKHSFAVAATLRLRLHRRTSATPHVSHRVTIDCVPLFDVRFPFVFCSVVTEAAWKKLAARRALHVSQSLVMRAFRLWACCCSCCSCCWN